MAPDLESTIERVWDGSSAEPWALQQLAKFLLSCTQLECNVSQAAAAAFGLPTASESIVAHITQLAEADPAFHVIRQPGSAVTVRLDVVQLRKLAAAAGATHLEDTAPQEPLPGAPSQQQQQQQQQPPQQASPPGPIAGTWAAVAAAAAARGGGGLVPGEVLGQGAAGATRLPGGSSDGAPAGPGLVPQKSSSQGNAAATAAGSSSPTPAATSNGNSGTLSLAARAPGALDKAIAAVAALAPDEALQLAALAAVGLEMTGDTKLKQVSRYMAAKVVTQSQDLHTKYGQFNSTVYSLTYDHAMVLAKLGGKPAPRKREMDLDALIPEVESTLLKAHPGMWSLYKIVARKNGQDQAMTHLEVARLLLSTASTLHSHMVQQQAAGVAPLAALRCNGLSKRILDTLQTPIAKDEQIEPWLIRLSRVLLTNNGLIPLMERVAKELNDTLTRVTGAHYTNPARTSSQCVRSRQESQALTVEQVQSAFIDLDLSGREAQAAAAEASVNAGSSDAGVAGSEGGDADRGASSPGADGTESGSSTHALSNGKAAEAAQAAAAKAAAQEAEQKARAEAQAQQEAAAAQAAAKAAADTQQAQQQAAAAKAAAEAQAQAQAQQQQQLREQQQAQLAQQAAAAPPQQPAVAPPAQQQQPQAQQAPPAAQLPPPGGSQMPSLQGGWTMGLLSPEQSQLMMRLQQQQQGQGQQHQLLQQAQQQQHQPAPQQQAPGQGVNALLQHAQHQQQMLGAGAGAGAGAQQQPQPQQQSVLGGSLGAGAGAGSQFLGHGAQLAHLQQAFLQQQQQQQPGAGYGAGALHQQQQHASSVLQQLQMQPQLVNPLHAALHSPVASAGAGAGQGFHPGQLQHQHPGLLGAGGLGPHGPLPHHHHPLHAQQLHLTQQHLHHAQHQAFLHGQQQQHVAVSAAAQQQQQPRNALAQHLLAAAAAQQQHQLQSVHGGQLGHLGGIPQQQHLGQGQGQRDEVVPGHVAEDLLRGLGI